MPCRFCCPSSADKQRECHQCDARGAIGRTSDLLEYAETIPPACDDEWHTSVACANSVDYSNACDGTNSFPFGLIPILHYQNPGYMGEPCRPERQALQDCVDKENPYVKVQGKKGTCDYTTGANDNNICQVFCDVGDNQFSPDCSGASGGPYECACLINGKPLDDDAFGYNPRFFASSCQDVAQHMADGECLDRVNCCFTWQNVQNKSGCACVSDPKLVGYDTCDAAAAATGGEVLDLCPQYAIYAGGLGSIMRTSTN